LCANTVFSIKNIKVFNGTRMTERDDDDDNVVNQREKVQSTKYKPNQMNENARLFTVIRIHHLTRIHTK